MEAKTTVGKLVCYPISMKDFNEGNEVPVLGRVVGVQMRGSAGSSVMVFAVKDEEIVETFVDKSDEVSDG